MTWSNRFRLIGGLIAVFIIVAASTLVLSQREGQTASSSASIRGLSYSIGSDWAGTVVQELVAVGDEVEKGTPLLSIQSPTLLGFIDNNDTVPESTAYTVSPEGLITLVATEAGIVSQITARVGGFVGAGEPLAVIDRGGELNVVAEFTVDSYDFARITEGALVEIVLPNHQRVTGQVSRLQVETVDGKAEVEAEVTSSELVRGDHDGLVAPGTPVTAILHLRDDGILAGLKDSYYSLVEQIGL